MTDGKDLLQMSVRDFAAAVADGLHVDTEKLAEQAATLPRGDAEQFEALLTEAGIPPILNKAGADMRMASGVLDALAAGYRR